MSSNSTDTDEGHQNKDSLISSMNFAVDEGEPKDRYEEYLTQGDQPKDQLSDTRNFFDDSNEEDRNWVKIAKKFLGKAG